MAELCEYSNDLRRLSVSTWWVSLFWFETKFCSWFAKYFKKNQIPCDLSVMGDLFHLFTFLPGRS